MTNEERTPVGTWVVLTGRVQASARTVWVWGLLGAGPGFDDVFYTEADGVTPADVEVVPTTLSTLFVAPAHRPWQPPAGLAAFRGYTEGETEAQAAAALAGGPDDHA